MKPPERDHWRVFNIVYTDRTLSQKQRWSDSIDIEFINAKLLEQPMTEKKILSESQLVDCAKLTKSIIGDLRKLTALLRSEDYGLRFSEGIANEPSGQYSGICPEASGVSQCIGILKGVLGGIVMAAPLDEPGEVVKLMYTADPK